MLSSRHLTTLLSVCALCALTQVVFSQQESAVVVSLEGTVVEKADGSVVTKQDGSLIVTTPNSDDEGGNTDDQVVDFSKDFTSIFEPTEEWQEVRDDQAIPGGLDIRMDLEHGKKYARLMPGAKPPTPRGSTGNTEETLTSGDQVKGEAAAQENSDGDVETMKRVLLELPEPEPELQDAIAKGYTQEQLNEVLKRVWERRQQQLEDALASMQTEGDEMKGSLDIIVNNTTDVDAVLGSLADLEYHVSSFHNAIDFAMMNGLPVVASLLNHDSGEVRASAAWVIGSASKYNSVIQDVVAATGLLPQLMNMLNDTIVNEDDKLGAKVFYAVRSIVRGSAPLQEQFLAFHGDDLLVRIMKMPSVNKWSVLAIHAVEFLTDLAQERQPQTVEGDMHSHAAAKADPTVPGTLDAQIEHDTAVNAEDELQKPETEPIKEESAKSDQDVQQDSDSDSVKITSFADTLTRPPSTSLSVDALFHTGICQGLVHAAREHVKSVSDEVAIVAALQALKTACKPVFMNENIASELVVWMAEWSVPDAPVDDSLSRLLAELSVELQQNPMWQR